MVSKANLHLDNPNLVCQWQAFKETQTKSNSFCNNKTKVKTHNNSINNSKATTNRKLSKMLWKVTHKLAWTKWPILYNNSSINKTKARSNYKSWWPIHKLRKRDRASCSSNNQPESKATTNLTFLVSHRDKVFSQFRVKLLSRKNNHKLSSRWCNSSNNRNLKTAARIQETQTKVSIKWANLANKSSKTNNSLVRLEEWTITPSSKVFNQ